MSDHEETKFERVNASRVQQLREVLARIGNSASSNRALLEMPELMEPFFEDLIKHDLGIGRVAQRPAGKIEDIDRPEPSLKLIQLPRYHRIAGFVAAIPDHQVRAYLTHLTNRLCEAAYGAMKGNTDDR